MCYNKYRLKFERNNFIMIIKDLRVTDYRIVITRDEEFGTHDNGFYTDDLIQGFLEISFF